MRRWFWTNWSIGARLALIILLPMVYLFASFIWNSYRAHQAHVAEELSERGRILAQALAETSEYNIISGNLADLKLTINSLINSDQSIEAIEVMDAKGQGLVRQRSTGVPVSQATVVEAPIRRQGLDLNLFTEDCLPHVSGVSDTKPRAFLAQPIGSVRVTMTPVHLLARQNARFVVELLMAALALAVSGTLAYFLGRRLTRDLQASRDQVLKADADKRKLIHKVHSIVEEERKGIAIEIHDELNASLIAARLQSQSIGQLASQLEAGPVAEHIKQKAQSITQLTLDLYASGRQLVRRLRPEVLDTLGLQGAAEEMVRHYGASRPQCQFEFHSSGTFTALGNALAISAYRIVQEALSNAVKHAQARNVSVSMLLDAQALHIAVADDGAGFDPQAVSDGIGMIGMRERVASAHGKIEWLTSLEQGTRVMVELPLSAVS